MDNWVSESTGLIVQARERERERDVEKKQQEKTLIYPTPIMTTIVNNPLWSEDL